MLHPHPGTPGVGSPAGNTQRWVWMYTCNFLNSYEDSVVFSDNNIMNVNNFVTDADLKAMMGGAHIVLGYATTAYVECLYRAKRE